MYLGRVWCPKDAVSLGNNDDNNDGDGGSDSDKQCRFKYSTYHSQ